MKKPLISILLLLFFLLGCRKDITLENPRANLVNPFLKMEGIQDCSFGKTDYNTITRTLSKEELATANRPSIVVNDEILRGKGRPGVILLDFDGRLITGTSFNYNGDFYATPANLTTAQVDEVIANVVHEYTDYNVVVTTDERIYNRAPIGKRTVCVFTENWQWFGQAGGVGFINSYWDGSDNPCFVFTVLLNYNTKYVKEAGVHEIGHTAGLYHQGVWDSNCVKIDEYNHGTATAAPNMGYPYDKPDDSTMWWIGTTSNACTEIQDDKYVLTLRLK